MEENINTAMLAIMNEVSYIQKERSKDVNYTLKTENAVIQAIRPAMVKHGVFMYPAGVKEVEHSQFEAGKYKNIWNRIVATHIYRFVHAPSGTSIDVEVLGDGADTGDKAGNKSMTTSKKYALLEAFLLETGDDPDITPSNEMTRNNNGQKKVELPKDDRMWTVAQKNALIDEKLAKNDFAARGMLGLSMLPVDATNQEIIEWGKVYRHYRIEEKMKAADAADKANAELLGVGA